MKHTIKTLIIVQIMLFSSGCSFSNKQEKATTSAPEVALGKRPVFIPAVTTPPLITEKEEAIISVPKTVIRSKPVFIPAVTTPPLIADIEQTRIPVKSDPPPSDVELIDESYLIIKRAFTTNDKDLLKKAIKAFDGSSPEKFSKYIKFIFREGLDSNAEAWEMRKLSIRFKEEHMPILLPYLKSENKIKVKLAARFLVAIGEPAYENLTNEITQGDPDGVISRSVAETVLFKNYNLSRSHKLGLLHTAYEKVGCYGVSILNTTYVLKDFSRKGHEIIRSCLRKPYVVDYAARVIIKSYSHIDDEEKKKYLPVLQSYPFNSTVQQALFAIGDVTPDTENEMLRQLRDPSFNQTLSVANELIIRGIHKEEAKIVYLNRIFNEKSQEIAVKNILPKLGTKIDFMLSDIIEKIEGESNQKIRQKALIYLIYVVNPNAFYAGTRKITPYSSKEIYDLSRVFEPYMQRLRDIAQKGKFEEGYVDMIFENLSWEIQ